MTHSLTDLPFTAEIDGAVHLWQPLRRGDYAADCDAGRAHADALASYIRETGNTPLYGRVVQAAAQVGKISGVEVGFFDRSAILMAGLAH